MKCSNIHYQRVISLCNKFQKGLCFSEESFIHDLKENMKLAESISEEERTNRLVEDIAEAAADHASELEKGAE